MVLNDDDFQAVGKHPSLDDLFELRSLCQDCSRTDHARQYQRHQSGAPAGGTISLRDV